LRRVSRRFSRSITPCARSWNRLSPRSRVSILGCRNRPLGSRQSGPMPRDGVGNHDR
jgi:hypothetical protein